MYASPCLQQTHGCHPYEQMHSALHMVPVHCTAVAAVAVQHNGNTSQLTR
jgi:hypothetical protein